MPEREGWNDHKLPAAQYELRIGRGGKEVCGACFWIHMWASFAVSFSFSAVSSMCRFMAPSFSIILALHSGHLATWRKN
jgi:hypothetical protein